MRILMPFTLLTFCHPVAALAQPASNVRTDLIYIIGQVVDTEYRSLKVDVGEAHTIEPATELAVFRSINGYFKAIGRVQVIQTHATHSKCHSSLTIQRGDLVMTVRELYQLHTGPIHRKRILKREVVRSHHQQSLSSFPNIDIANALSDYERSYPNWRRDSKRIAGRMLARSLQSPRTGQLDQLEQQLALMRKYYRQSPLAVASAGDNWASVMQVLAGPTATAGHELLLENPNKEGLQISASELRERVLAKVFHLHPEQQNMVAMIVAILTQENRANIRSFLTAVLPQTQFPGLKEDTQLVLDIENILRELQANS
jgi:hypothetical protein